MYGRQKLKFKDENDVDFQARANPSKLYVIRGMNVYNLSDFQYDHPGGKIVLQ